MKDFQDLILDGTKIGWHADRVKPGKMVRELRQ